MNKHSIDTIGKVEAGRLTSDLDLDSLGRVELLGQNGNVYRRASGERVAFVRRPGTPERMLIWARDATAAAAAALPGRASRRGRCRRIARGLSRRRSSSQA